MANSKVKKTSGKSWGSLTGGGKMFGQQGAKPAPSGKVSTSQGGKGANFASGGRGKMFGYTGAQRATAGNTVK